VQCPPNTACECTLVVNHDHLALGLVGLHHPMSLAYFLKAERPGWLYVETTRRSVHGRSMKFTRRETLRFPLIISHRTRERIACRA
jgi:hypothetical protein